MAQVGKKGARQTSGIIKFKWWHVYLNTGDRWKMGARHKNKTLLSTDIKVIGKSYIRAKEIKVLAEEIGQTMINEI